MFYHAGEFFSRDNIHPGMLTLHPCGFTHGPHPKALANAFEQTAPGTNEVAVMIDTRDALQVLKMRRHVEWPDYVDSWKGAAPERGTLTRTRQGLNSHETCITQTRP